MKNGTFVIVEKDGKKVAAILRADKQFVYLEDLPVTSYLVKLDGKPCQYLINGNSRVVNIDGKNIYFWQLKTAEKPLAQNHNRKPTGAAKCLEIQKLMNLK